MSNTRIAIEQCVEQLQKLAQRYERQCRPVPATVLASLRQQKQRAREIDNA